MSLHTLPWTQDTVKLVLKSFSGNAAFQIPWPWAPYHERGFNALYWMARNSMPERDFKEILKNMSCPSAPKKDLRRLRASKLVDHDERLITLDPGPAILSYYEKIGKNLTPFRNGQALLLKISDLFLMRPEICDEWRPVFDEDFSFFKSWVSKNVTLIKCFQSAKPWDQLQVIESFVGMIKPSSVLKFERIY